MSDDTEQVRKWRQKAEECRAVGDQMHIESSREAFARMAATYDQLADNLESRLRGPKGRKPPETG